MSSQQAKIAQTRADLGQARLVSAKRRHQFEQCQLSDPQNDPSKERPPVDNAKEIKMATLGAKMATKEPEAIIKEDELLTLEESANIVSSEEALMRRKELCGRYLSTSQEYWSHERVRRLRTGVYGASDSRVWDMSEPRFSEAIMLLIRRQDGLGGLADQPTQFQPEFRAKAFDYYGATDDMAVSVRCQMSGLARMSSAVKAARILPLFRESESLASALFGEGVQDLDGGGNSLLLDCTLETWFSMYQLVIVPADNAEFPIKRWRTDIVSEIKSPEYEVDRPTEELHGKEMVFEGNRLPVAKFLYLRFILTLVRIKNLNRPGWRDVWARYYEQRPFPAPGNYLRRSILESLVRQYRLVESEVLASWMGDQGFDTGLQLDCDESDEVARIVLQASERDVDAAEYRQIGEDEMGGDYPDKEVEYVMNRNMDLLEARMQEGQEAQEETAGDD